MTMKNFFLIACCAMFIVLLSCKKDPKQATNITFGNQADIPWLACTYFMDHQLSICFDGANEYRCPCFADCLWEGATDVNLNLTFDSSLDTIITLTTNSSPANLPYVDTIGGKIIRFVETNITDCNDYGKYEKYKVTITVE
jgi:hypothetical protein